MKQKFLLKTMLLLLALVAGSGSVWAQTADVTYDFTGSGWSVSNGTLTNGTVSFTGEGGANFKMNSGYFMMGKSGAYINFPIYSSPVAKIVVTGTSGASESVKQNIYVNDVAVSTETTGAKNVSNEYEIASAYQAAGTQYTLKVTSSHNTQISKIEIYYAASTPSNTWTVTYNGNGATSGNVPTDATEYSSTNSTVTVLGNTGSLAKTGYTFAGWNTSADGSGDDYDANDTFTITANTTLFAQWTANTYTVTLPAADTYGSYAMDATNPVAYGTEVTLTYTPASGYENYQATWSVNSTAISGNTFTMPNEAVTVTVSVNKVVDYATLPFSWAGGARSDFEALNGCSTSGAGDYPNQTTYQIKLDNTDDYIQIKTNERPGVVTIGVKMVGGSSSSSIKVQQSANGTTFTDLETLSISGSQNDVLTLTTTADFAAETRYVRLNFTKGSNVGVGPISIAQYVAVVHTLYALTVSNLTNVNTFVFDADDQSNSLLEGEGTVQVLDGTRVIVSTDVNQNCELQSLVVDGDDVTSEIDETGAYTFTMPTHPVTISASAIEIVTNTYTLATEVVPGRHYIIVGKKDNNYYAMGKTQNSNNRAAVGITVDSNTATVSSNDVAEVLIEIEEGTGYFTISDEAYDNGNGGYLYAASSGNSTSNYMRTYNYNSLSDLGRWTISIADDGVATVVSTGANRPYMRFNSGSILFSCYQQGSQQNIYLYEKDGDTGNQTTTVSIVAACTDGNKYYGTYSAPFAFTVPSADNLTVSSIAVDGDGKLTVSPYTAGDIVKANTGVMISSSTSGDHTVILSSEVGTEHDGNMLKASGTGIDADGMTAAAPSCTYYRLTMHGGTQIGFYWGAAGGAAFDLGANKAYLAVPSTSARIEGLWFGDDATAIESVNVSKNLNGEVYDLQGRRVAQPQKGLYIVNGKKVVIK